MKIRVTASTNSVGRKLRAVERKTEAPDEQYIAWLKRSAQRMRSFWSNRFDRFSRGGGNWKRTKRLKNSKGKRKVFILRLTHTLFRALSPVMRGLPGQWEKITGNNIETGFGGSSRHPNAKMAVHALAEIHQEGHGFNPKRKMIVRPDMQTRQQIIDDGERMLKRGN